MFNVELSKKINKNFRQLVPQGETVGYRRKLIFNEFTILLMLDGISFVCQQLIAINNLNLFSSRFLYSDMIF